MSVICLFDTKINKLKQYHQINPYNGQTIINIYLNNICIKLLFIIITIEF